MVLLEIILFAVKQNSMFVFIQLSYLRFHKEEHNNSSSMNAAMTVSASIAILYVTKKFTLSLFIHFLQEVLEEVHQKWQLLQERATF